MECDEDNEDASGSIRSRLGEGEAVQNCYPIAMEPLDMRNERGFDGLGRVGGLGRKTSVWATRPAGSPGKGGALRPARSACKLAFAMQI